MRARLEVGRRPKLRNIVLLGDRLRRPDSCRSGEFDAAAETVDERSVHVARSACGSATWD